jgi:hypothetical protein
VGVKPLGYRLALTQVAEGEWRMQFRQQRDASLSFAIKNPVAPTSDCLSISAKHDLSS